MRAGTERIRGRGETRSDLTSRPRLRSRKGGGGAHRGSRSALRAGTHEAQAERKTRGAIIRLQGFGLKVRFVQARQLRSPSGVRLWILVKEVKEAATLLGWTCCNAAVTPMTSLERPEVGRLPADAG